MSINNTTKSPFNLTHDTAVSREWSLMLHHGDTVLACTFDPNADKHKASIECSGSYGYAVRLSVECSHLDGDVSLQKMVLNWATWWAAENVQCDKNHATYWRELLAELEAMSFE